MKILFLTLMTITDFSQTGIYPDLINSFADHGHDIFVVTPCENRNRKTFSLLKEKGQIHLISALIPNYYGVGLIKKGLSSLVIGKCFLLAIEKAIPDVKFDMILYSTPPITFCGLIDKIKRRDNAFAYLLLKDIWPQGPIDIGALSTTGFKGIVTKYFQAKEKRLYAVSDYIGCMSSKNCQYLVNNSRIEKTKVEICPNSIKVTKSLNVDKKSIRNDYGLPVDKTIFVYGGNLGIAQGIDFIISCLANNEERNNSFLLIIGSGTEYSMVRRKQTAQ